MAKKKKIAKTKVKLGKPLPETKEARGLLLLALSLGMFLSFLSFAYGQESHNWLGLIGHFIGWIFHAFFGISSYLIAIFLGWIGWRLFFKKTINNPYFKTACFFVCIISISFLLSLIEITSESLGDRFREIFYPALLQKRLSYHFGGAPFYYLLKDLPGLNLMLFFNALGVALLFSSTLLVSLLLLAKISPSQGIHWMREKLARLKTEAKKATLEAASYPKPSFEVEEKSKESLLRYVKLKMPPLEAASTPRSDLLAIQPEQDPLFRPSISRKEQMQTALPKIAQEPLKSSEKSFEEKREFEVILASSPQTKKEKAVQAQKVYNGDFTAFKLPDASLLSNAKKVDQTHLKKDLKKQAEVLEETLSSFGIEAKVGQINCGPTITSFEVHPAIGVKVQKIKALENDIALNLEAKSIRIIAPIPGKAAVGIEVPNPQPQEVSYKEILQAYQRSPQKCHIPILLGKTVHGDYVMSDLAKMPHCIIAGATGSGKSVCINTIVMSIIMNARPDEIKLVMVDPKKVELTPYAKLPHMLAPVICEPGGACAALLWMVKEMEKRYELLKILGVRNIEAFNQRAVNPEFEASLGKEIPLRLPFIVGIIDELADLMMVSSHDIETPIARIAQMARAVGIHLILATQRPSREVITGLIKANFPTRIAFKVSSRINSQIILDETGAETLLGNGDLLFLPPGSSHLVRAQGAYIRDEDIHAVVKYVCDQAPPNYEIQSFDAMGGGEENLNEEPTDTLYEQAKEIVIGTGNASTTFLQRKLKIGYARAASLMDQLEMRGVIGPADGSKARLVMQTKLDHD